MPNYSINPPQVAGCVIRNDDKYLLVQEKLQKAYGLWNLPAGRSENGETLEETAVREAYEETGYRVTLVRKLLTTKQEAGKATLHSYLAEIEGGKLTLKSDEIMDLQWFTFQQIEQMLEDNLLRVHWVIDSIRAERDRVA